MHGVLGSGVCLYRRGKANTAAVPSMASVDTGQGDERASEGAWLQRVVYGALKSVAFGA